MTEAEYWDEQAATFDQAADHALVAGVAELGHPVVGADFAPRMFERLPPPGWAEGEFRRRSLPSRPGAMRDPGAAIAQRVRLLAPGGRLLPVERTWWSGTALTAKQTQALLLQHRRPAEVTVLDAPALGEGQSRTSGTW